MNERNIEGQIRSAAHRFFDLEDGILKTKDFLLDELKKRISLG